MLTVLCLWCANQAGFQASLQLNCLQAVLAALILAVLIFAKFRFNFAALIRDMLQG